MRTREKALCCVLRDGAFAFTVRHDGHPLATTFLIPPGGGLKSGESPGHAAAREAREELGQDITGWDLLTTCVDEFTFRGEEHRETVHVFVVELPVGASLPSHIRESNGRTHPLRWLAPAELRTCGLPVYPDGLTEVLIRYAASR